VKQGGTEERERGWERKRGREGEVARGREGEREGGSILARHYYVFQESLTQYSQYGAITCKMCVLLYV
jgi:hypothetical protein